MGGDEALNSKLVDCVCVCVCVYVCVLEREGKRKWKMRVEDPLGGLVMGDGAQEK